MTINNYPLGKITKTHGYEGAVILVSRQPLYEEMEERLKEIFIVVDGLKVPFPVKDFHLLTENSALMQLEFVDSREEALTLTDCETYAEIAPCATKIQTELDQWIGFTVCDSVHGKIGTIQNIEDYQGNVVMQVQDDGREILISLYPELVTGINESAKLLHITAPDGYF